MFYFTRTRLSPLQHPVCWPIFVPYSGWLAFLIDAHQIGLNAYTTHSMTLTLTASLHNCYQWGAYYFTNIFLGSQVIFFYEEVVNRQKLCLYFMCGLHVLYLYFMHSDAKVVHTVFQCEDIIFSHVGAIMFFSHEYRWPWCVHMIYNYFLYIFWWYCNSCQFFQDLLNFRQAVPHLFLQTRLLAIQKGWVVVVCHFQLYSDGTVVQFPNAMGS